MEQSKLILEKIAEIGKKLLYYPLNTTYRKDIQKDLNEYGNTLISIHQNLIENEQER